MQQPPNSNGVMDLTQDQIFEIKLDLQIIAREFQPTEDEPVLTTHGLVSRFNLKHVGSEINGDTAEYVMTH